MTLVHEVAVISLEKVLIFWIRAVPDPDLEICGEGGGHPNSEI